MPSRRGTGKSGAAVPGPTDAVAGPPARLPAFVLADQFGGKVNDEAYRGVPLIVVVGNRTGAGGVALWTASLRAVIGPTSETHVLPVADLRGVPRMLRRMVSRLLPREPAHWCALDWDGQIGAPIRREEGPLVAAAFGATRELRVFAALPLDTVDSATLVILVEGALT